MLCVNKIGFDISSLWRDQEDRFTLRFNDISENQQQKLAERIKICAYQYRLSKLGGPTIEEIKTILKQINIFIFKEGSYRTVNPHKSFSYYAAQTINGWHFKNLSRAVFLLLCMKRKLKKREIEIILRTVTTNYPEVCRLLEENLLETTQETRETIEIPEIGIEEMGNIRARVEERENHNPNSFCYSPTSNTTGYQDRNTGVYNSNTITVSPTPTARRINNDNNARIARERQALLERLAPSISNPLNFDDEELLEEDETSL